MPAVTFLERVAGAVAGAAARILKARVVVYFDPSDFDTDDYTPSAPIQTGGDSPGIASSVTRIRIRALLSKDGLTFMVSTTASGGPVNGLVFQQNGTPFAILDLDESAAFWDGFPRHVFPTTAVPSGGLTGKVQLQFNGTNFTAVLPNGDQKKFDWSPL